MQLGLTLQLVTVCVAMGTVKLTSIDDDEGRGNMWKVAVGMDWGAHEYINERGYLTGFGIEFVDLVCEAAGMICLTVRDTYENCWNTSKGQHATGGKGLQGRWYDACMGWAVTVERIHVFSFSASYLEPDTSGTFFVRKGEAEAFNPFDLQNKKIGFLKGWTYSEDCIAREKRIQNNKLKQIQIHQSEGPKQIIEELENGEFDAIFAGGQTFSKAQRATIEAVPGLKVTCMLNGNAMMTRKTSFFNVKWNVGFHKVRANGRFQKLCDRWRKEYGDIGEIRCL